MQSKDLYERLLGLEKPWRVESVDMDAEERTVEVRVGCRPGSRWASEDGRRLHVHGWEERGWRELNTFHFETRIVCNVPRVKDPDTGKTETVSVPWAAKNSRFTLMFEAFAIQVLRASVSVEGARKLLGLDWRAVDRIRARAVERGLSQREDEPFRYMGIDETSLHKGHSCVSVCGDLDRGRVIEVTPERTEEAARTAMNSLSQAQEDRVEADNLDAAKAWNFRDLFDRFWKFKAAPAAELFLHRWSERVEEASLEPMVKVAGTLKNHLEGLLGYVYHLISNAGAEGLNSKIQAIKTDARGFRSFSKFRFAILFHCGKLDRIPQ